MHLTSEDTVDDLILLMDLEIPLALPLEVPFGKHWTCQS
jgi:hypothetical protein